MAKKATKAKAKPKTRSAKPAAKRAVKASSKTPRTATAKAKKAASRPQAAQPTSTDIRRAYMRSLLSDYLGKTK